VLDLATLQCARGWDIVLPNEAASAAAFDKALSELSGEELREGSKESSGYSDSAREPARQAAELEPLKITRDQSPTANQSGKLPNTNLERSRTPPKRIRLGSIGIAGLLERGPEELLRGRCWVLLLAKCVLNHSVRGIPAPEVPEEINE
jgi:hypothetical protein